MKVFSVLVAVTCISVERVVKVVISLISEFIRSFNFLVLMEFNSGGLLMGFWSKFWKMVMRVNITIVIGVQTVNKIVVASLVFVMGVVSVNSVNVVTVLG